MGVLELGAHDHDIVGLDKTEHVARDLFDEIGMRLGRRQQRNVTLKFAANGLKAARFEGQQAGPFDQTRTRLKAMPAVNGMVAEVSHKAQAEKHYRGLPELPPLVAIWLTQHNATRIPTQTTLGRYRLKLKLA
jgi:hypothetical protein